MTLEELQYPIGKANIPENITKKNIESWISDIERYPQELEFLVRELSHAQLDTPYRENGWTIRQVIHHSYDSHHNSYTRFKWALTEDQPVIKAYFEERWAELSDSKSGPILLTIDALKGLHAKWVYLLRNLTDKELEKIFIHPAGNEEVSLKENIGIYAWHCQHHYAHIEQLMIRKVGSKMKEEITFEDFLKVDIRIGTIIEVNDFPKARKPAYQLKIDFGDLGIKKSSAQITDLYTKEGLLNKQVSAVINFKPRQIANFKSEVLVLGVYNTDESVVLLQASKPIKNGEQVS